MAVNRYQLIEEIRTHLRPEDSSVAVNLPTYNLADLQMILSNLKNRLVQERERDHTAAQVQEQIARDAAAIVKQTMAAERAALAEQQREVALQAVLFQIYRTPVAGKLLVQNQANEQMLLSLLHPHEQLSVSLFKQIAADHANKFTWQSDRVLDPEYRKKQAEAQLEADHRIFLGVCKERGIGFSTANFNLVRSTLGPNLDAYQVKQAIDSGAVHLSPATQAELDQWRAEAVEAHNAALRNADVGTLRKIVRNEAAQSHVTEQQKQADRDFEAAQARDAYGGYKPMPDTFRGEALDSRFIKRCSTEVLRQLIRLYGSAAVTARLRSAA